MADIEILLSRLDKVKRTGQSTWMARCPAHDDRTPSLSIREANDGRILLHCFGNECSFEEIVSAIGLSASDLSPEKPNDFHGKPERRPFPAQDILQALSFELMTAYLILKDALAGKVTAEGNERLLVAVERVSAALNAGGIR